MPMQRSGPAPASRNRAANWVDCRSISAYVSWNSPSTTAILSGALNAWREIDPGIASAQARLSWIDIGLRFSLYAERTTRFNPILDRLISPESEQCV
jgi:hypothetical protein